MKWTILIFVFLFSFGLVDATIAEVVMVDDVGSFSGAVLRIVSPVSGEIGDKIYASEYLTQSGVIKFEIESSLAEIDLNIVVTKNGVVVDIVEEGPFVVNGSRILIDRREGINRNQESEVSSQEAIEEAEVLEKELGVEVVVDVSSGDSLREKLGRMFLTGKVVFAEEDGSINLGFSAGGFVLILMFIFFIFMMVRRGKIVEDVLGEDDKELVYMEKRVRETEGRISKIKGERDKKKRIENAKIKLNKEKKELEELEKTEREGAEKIEDA